MDNLKSLVMLIGKHKIKHIDIVGTQNDASPTKINQLYEGIASGEIHTDREAISQIYYGEPNGAAKGAYKKLKLRLESKLCNTVFFIDQNEAKFNNTSAAYYNSYRNLAAFKILIGKGGRMAAIPLAEKAIRQAVKFGITPVVAELAGDLRNHYAVNEANKRKFNKYHQLAEQYGALRQAELRAESLYASIMVKVSVKRSSDLESAEQASRFVEELDGIKAKLPRLSFRFNQLYYMLKALQFEIRNDLEKLIEVCHEALRSFEDPSLRMPDAARFNFAFRLMQAYTQTKKFDAALKALYTCNKLVPEGSTNWFLLRSEEVILYLHAGQFEMAHQAYRVATANKAYDRQYQMSAERWMIIEAYIQYLIGAGKIPLHNELERPKKFKVQKFLNEFVVFSKDKTGYNLDLIILQVLFRLQRKEYDSIMLRIDSWQKYASRHLNKNQSKRSRIFLKMILTLPKYYFKKTVVENKNRKLRDLLQQMSQNNKHDNEDPEIIPYETLWTFVLDSLDDRLY